jgi:hypothetical protein
MAGFAIFMTIIMLGIAGIVIASILSVRLYVVGRRRVHLGLSRQNAAIVGALAPFIGLLWIVLAFLIHVQISNRIAHQDCGLSGDPYVTLPNGYVLGSLNTYSGYIKAPGYETDTPVAGPGYVRSIIDLKFSDPYFMGTQFDHETSSVRSFVFNTRTLEFRTSEPKTREGPPLDPSAQAALDAWGDAQTHVHTDPDSYWTMYERFRHRWPKYVFWVIFFAGEFGIFLYVRDSWNRPLKPTI